MGGEIAALVDQNKYLAWGNGLRRGGIDPWRVVPGGGIFGGPILKCGGGRGGRCVYVRVMLIC